MRLLASKTIVLSLAVAIATLAAAHADDQQAAKDADLALMGALAKGDRQAAAARDSRASSRPMPGRIPPTMPCARR